jgi:hypothetical protein
MGFLSGLLDPGNVFNSREGGVSLTGMFDPAGAALNAGGAMPDFYDKINGSIDDWAGDVYDFEKSNFSDMWKKFKDDPTQLLIGAGDPFSAKVWSKATGKDYDPYVNQMGGATNDAYESAERKGIDTSNARGAHQVAQAIASFYGGGWCSRSSSRYWCSGRASTRWCCCWGCQRMGQRWQVHGGCCAGWSRWFAW